MRNRGWPSVGKSGRATTRHEASALWIRSGYNEGFRTLMMQIATDKVFSYLPSGRENQQEKGYESPMNGWTNEE